MPSVAAERYEFRLYLLGLVAAAMKEFLLYVNHDKESDVSKVSLNIPRYADQPTRGSNRNT